MPKRSFRLSDHKPDAKADVDDEVAFHLEMRTREFMEQGLSAEEARRRAAASFGDVQAIRSDLQQARAARNEEHARRDWWSALRMDLRYAVRSLRHSRAFTAAAVATLALGTGATLAVFTVVNGVLLRPLPYPDPSRLVMIWMTMPSENFDIPLSSGFVNDLEQGARSFEGVAAIRSWSYALAPRDGGASEVIAGARVSPAFFGVLGVRPLLGRWLASDAAVPGGPREVVLGHALWQRRFGRDRSIIGRTVTLSGESFTVTGVMPPGFAFPRGAELPAPLGFGLHTDLWTPLVLDAADRQNYSVENLTVVGRRRAWIGLAQAEAEVGGVLKRVLDRRNWHEQFRFHLVPIADQAARPVRRGLLILMGAVLLLLVIACANVTSLLVTRAYARQRELAIRAALGAGRGRIARQLIAENVLLAVAGSAVGGLIGYWGTHAMLTLVPGSMPRADDIGLDWRVFCFTGLIALAAGIAFGVVSTYTVRWDRLMGALRAGGTRTTSDRRRRGRDLLVVGQVALSLTLLIGGALLTSSFLRLQRVDPGFRPEHVLVATMGLPVAGRFDPATDGARWARVLTEATARLNRAAGVLAAGAVSALPLSGTVEAGGTRIPGREQRPDEHPPSAQYAVVSGEYFGAMQIRLVAGRTFDSSDDAPGAGSAIVNREFVRRYLGADNAGVLDREVYPLFTFTRGAKAHRIVGVVENVKQETLDADAVPQIYVPQSQMPYPFLTIVLRTMGDPRVAVATLRRELLAVDPTLTLRDILTYDDVLASSLARQRFSMTLIGVFAGCALVLALIGLYGVVALVISQRTREIGIRLMLGARPADVVRMVALEGLRVVVAGIGLGVLGAFALTRVLQTMLYDVSATDAATFIGAAGVVLLVASSAAFVPARRAARTDPVTILQSD